jgi:hypothetical protein
MSNFFTEYAKFGKVTEAEVIGDTAVKADSGRLGHWSFYSQLYSVLSIQKRNQIVLNHPVV